MVVRKEAQEGKSNQDRKPALEDAMVKLIHRYRRLPGDKRDGMTEQETCTKFILPMLKALGWDIENIDDVREQHRTAYGPSDYELLTGGVPRVVIETKRISNDLDGHHVARGKKIPYPTQAIQYAWNLRVDWVVLTNFEEIRLYHALAKTPEDGLVFAMSVDDILHRLDDLSLLAKESVESGRLDALNLRRGRKAVDRQVVDDLNTTRREMYDDILQNNAGTAADGGLRMMVQTLMDRLLVMRVAEDRGLFEADTLRGEIDRWRKTGLRTSFARRLRMQFGEFEEVYNTALFKSGPIDDIVLSNVMLTRAIDRLYAYDFSLIDSDVLGNIYEDYLTVSLMDTGKDGGGRFHMVADNKERKKLGIYYTPTHLVSHILDKTLGKKLAGCKTPEDVSKIKVLDPSCGSGSFLIKAFDLFIEWYREYNRKVAKKMAAGATATTTASSGKRVSGGNGTLDEDLEAVTDPERRILRDNLFGIDVDPQAAGVAAVNLMLKAMTRNEKLTQILGTNILVGNSLVTGSEAGCGELGQDELASLRPLDAARLPHERFDVIVGNPPYYAVRGGNPIRVSGTFEAVRSGGTVNAAMMFVKRSIELLDDGGGMLGLVIPKACSYAKGWSGTRDLLFRQLRLTGVVDCMEAFRGVNLEQIIVLGEKAGGKHGGGGGGTYEVGRAGPDSVQGGRAVGWHASHDEDMIHVEADPASWSIAEKMRAAGTRLGDLLRGDGCMITTGEYMQGLDCWLKDRPRGGLRMLAGDDIARYRIAASLYYRRGDLPAAPGGGKAGAALAPHVVGQRIVAHIGRPVPHIAMAFAYDEEGSRAFDTVTHVMPGKKISPHALVSILNSRAVSWYAHRFVFCNAVRSMDLRPWYMAKIVVPNVDAGAERALAGLGRRMGALASSRDAQRPRLRDYLTERTEGTLRLRDYIRAASPGDRRIHDKATVGEASRIEAVDEGGGWLGFFADYSPPRTRSLRRKKIVSLRVRDRGIREYVRTEASGGLRPVRGAALYDQAAEAKIKAYGRSLAENTRMLRSMLGPYARDAARHEAWRGKFEAADAEIDRIVCRAFGLSGDEEGRINGASRPQGWSNY